MKIFVPLARNCTRNACTTWALVSVLIRDGFGACFVVPEVVQTILHFGNAVAVIYWQKYIGKKRLAFVCKKNSQSYPNAFF